MRRKPGRSVKLQWVGSSRTHDQRGARGGTAKVVEPGERWDEVAHRITGIAQSVIVGIGLVVWSQPTVVNAVGESIAVGIVIVTGIS